MRSVFPLALIAALCGCATAPRNASFQTSIANNPSGIHSVLVGVAEGLPITDRSLRQLSAAWRTSAGVLCNGPYVGEPSSQISSFAEPGQPFADPYSYVPGTDVRLTAMFGQVSCTSLVAARMPNYVSEPTAGDLLQSNRLLLAGSGSTRR
jgi:hypothetical protein